MHLMTSSSTRSAVAIKWLQRDQWRHREWVERVVRSVADRARHRTRHGQGVFRPIWRPWPTRSGVCEDGDHQRLARRVPGVLCGRRACARAGDDVREGWAAQAAVYTVLRFRARVGAAAGRRGRQRRPRLADRAEQSITTPQGTKAEPRVLPVDLEETARRHVARLSTSVLARLNPSPSPRGSSACPSASGIPERETRRMREGGPGRGRPRSQRSDWRRGRGRLCGPRHGGVAAPPAGVKAGVGRRRSQVARRARDDLTARGAAAEAAAAGDFGYSYGTFGTTAQRCRPAYLRFWNRDASGRWWLMVDVAQPARN